MGKNKKSVYMDHASSAPMSAEVFSAMKKFLTINHSNPGALHKEGLAAKGAIENARKSVAHILGAQKEEIIFTSGGTESNNLAILGVVSEYVSSQKNFLGPRAAKLLRPRKRGKQSLLNQTLENSFATPHIITTNIEHSSVLEACRHLEKTKQAEVTYVSVESNGVVDPKKIREAIKKNTVLISVMYANNEIGTIQPITEIAKEIRHFRKINNTRFPFFHTDAAQAMNYLPVKMDKLGVDLLSFNGSKIYGPKGTGTLYKKRNVGLAPIMFGGDQEFGLKPGTENVAGIVGLARALEIAEAMKEKESKRLVALRDYFIKKLKSKFSSIVINGDLEKRLPNNVNISVPGIESDLLVLELDAHGIAVSAKSACKSDDRDESFTIRFSLGRGTSKADIDYTLKALSHILAKLKKWYN